MRSETLAIIVTVAFVGGYIVGKFAWKPEDITAKYPEVATAPTPTTRVRPVHENIYELILTMDGGCNDDAVNIRIKDKSYAVDQSTLILKDLSAGLFEIKARTSGAGIRFYDHELEMVWCVQ